ncbi:uncharacterized protein BP5553_05124 [Venustampulla echinocandica]|uniref:AAA+ ATPase domain-containing protein n=1 Tax=Venustampulla echinocandica TaxID=2656787 RepID=A0A370TQ87_9HELO|nr:uncharacterized protein BP5553_05124 [Venustampulla echinocandica]RDL37691.1 hypothetical protein BP5553_05124 [Venustampulla echinocandica]
MEGVLVPAPIPPPALDDVKASLKMGQPVTVVSDSAPSASESGAGQDAATEAVAIVVDGEQPSSPNGTTVQPESDPSPSLEKPEPEKSSADNSTKDDNQTATVAPKDTKDERMVDDDARSEDDANSEMSSIPERKPRIPAIPEIRKVNFENFKNHYCEKDSHYAIDVLFAKTDLNHDIRREQLTRGNHRERPKAKKDDVPQTEPSVTHDDGWIQRVRIQSQPILLHLAKVVGESWTVEQPRTFFRPFRVFIYFQPKMKEALSELEAKWGEAEKLELAASAKEAAAINTPSAEGNEAEASSDSKVAESKVEDGVGAEDTDHYDDESLDSIMDSIEALRDMRCYINFIDKEIMPLYQLFDGTTRQTIRFDDLWLLFRTGEIIFAPPGAENSHVGTTKKSQQRYAVNSQRGMYQTVWRVYTVNNPDDRHEYPSLEIKSKPLAGDYDNGINDSINDFKVWVYYIDFDGVSYGAVKKTFGIRRYEGEKDIRLLDCYPIRYEQNHEQILVDLRKHGKLFQECLDKRHLAYNGWTLTSNPTGESIEDDSGDLIKHPEFVESHVIVDFVEAFQTYPSWRPQFHQPAAYTDDWPTDHDEFAIKLWADSSRSKLVSETIEIIQENDGVTMWDRKYYLDKDEFLNQCKTQSSSGREKAAVELRDDDLILLPSRLFAYVLRERKFVLLDVRYLRPISEQRDVFSRLKILREYKDIVKALVGSHFVKKDLERRYNSISTEGLSQDLIQGKGRGLVILLHGVPGVGKTATAEAVALENQKPLFSITCGDLGLTPSEVESSLTEVFRLAHLWDCVLLLDEADVFLSQRSRLDLKRNALVSVFLRVLEYYNGILFLTTNRVGTLDEAFKSRIHMSLYYPPLEKVQAKQIFKMNIERLKEIENQRSMLIGEAPLLIQEDKILEFAESHFDNTKSAGRWNGRQIRNAFQIASSLAYHKNRMDNAELLKNNPESKPNAPVLDADNFKKVELATRAFDRYMEEAKGWADADFAHMLGERADYVKNTKFSAPRNPPNDNPDFYGGIPGSYSQGAGVHGVPDYNQMGGHGYSQPQDGSARFVPGPQVGHNQGSPYQPAPFPQNPGLSQRSSSRLDQPPAFPLSQQTPPRGTAAPSAQGPFDYSEQNYSQGDPRGQFGQPQTQSPGYTHNPQRAYRPAVDDADQYD